ncbi:MAG TPA: hypothetical protein VJA26_00880 [Gammaproteobacteria bacterium]|nr:hypothetical protein [Gammaproteobacteria bacterium]
MTEDWKKELVLAVFLLGFGLLIMPFAIYWVGQQVVGEYAPDAGVFDLAEHVWWDLTQLSLPAWTLVLSPYLCVQLLRVARSSWRYARTVKQVTISRDER